MSEERELRKGSAELLILSLVEDQPRHGYEISKQIKIRSQGKVLTQAAASSIASGRPSNRRQISE